MIFPDSLLSLKRQAGAYARRAGMYGLLAANLAAGQNAGTPDVHTIVERSVAAGDRDFKAAPQYNYKQRERTAAGDRTLVVTMLYGSPYERVIAINGKPLDAERVADETKKQKRAEAQRRSESSEQRKHRIAKYERDRTRDHEMMSQLSKGFDFKLAGEMDLRGFKVWHLNATPRAGYRPPNMQSQVLRGMEGELWIDQKTYEWVRVSARVIHPVSIEGFLARVQPGTQFEVEKSPVEGEIWQITHFAMQANAKVLMLVKRNEEEEDTFYDFEKAKLN